MKPLIDYLISCLTSAFSNPKAAKTVILENFNRYIQMDDYSCGAMAAVSVLRYYGKRCTISHIRKQSGLTEDGLNQWQLRKLFARYGLQCKRINNPTLKKLRNTIDNKWPVLVSVDKDHWSTIYGYKKGRGVYVADPSIVRGPQQFHNTKTFLRRWDRWAMAIYPRQ